MSNWGISPNASEKEKIKADYADILHGMNSTGAIPYDVYSDLFDDGMELLDRMYEQGKADCLLELGVTVQEWIPVSERLPEVARRVLVTDGENVSFGYVLNYERKDLNPWCTQSPCLPHTTTHWMPLPSAPKGE